MSNYKSKNHSKFTKELTIDDRVWTCVCGEVINIDENAAINILNVGLNMV